MKSDKVVFIALSAVPESTRELLHPLINMSFTNKVVLITGASAGIGAATAELFAKESAQLALVGRNEKNLKEVVAACQKNKGVKVLPIVADMSKDEDVKRIIKETIDTFGRLDVLVNNAGFGVPAPLGEEGSLAVYDRIMATNVRGVYQLTGLAIPHLAKTKGNIVNISSVGGQRPYPPFSAYNISKAALDMFTRCAALELGPKGIRVNVVSPGLTRTKFMNAVGFSDDQASKFYEEGASAALLGKVAEGEEVAEQILHLASDKAKSITGITVVIDNGEMLRTPSLPEPK